MMDHQCLLPARILLDSVHAPSHRCLLLSPLGAGSVRAVACTAPDSLLTLGDGSAVVVIRAGSVSLVSDDEDPSSTKPTPGVTELPTHPLP